MGKPACSVLGCESETKHSGMCQLHYHRMWKNGSVGPVGRIRETDPPGFRTCRLCGMLSSDMSLFMNKRSDGRDSYDRVCRDCWYSENAENTKFKTFVNNFVKSNAPCTDCGGYFPAVSMDWDHLPGSGSKRANVATYAANGTVPYKTMREEIEKCELVCANCHRVRTATRARQ